MSNLRLHREHGVNPTIPVCAWCGEDKNEVVLLGATYKKKAPMHMIIDDEPCDNCKDNMAKGITLVQCDASGKRTGTWTVIREQWIKDSIQSESLRDAILKRRMANILVEDWLEMGLPTEDSK